MRELGRWVLVLSALGGTALLGCEGEAPVAPQNDGGPDGQIVVAPDTGPVDVCGRDQDCRDELFCNGQERCRPGEPGTDARGCLPGTSPCAATEVCDEAEDRCQTDDCADGGDADGDGDRRPGCGGNDCNDDDPRVYSTAQEVCDDAGLDEDCNPDTIYNARTNDGDRDRDGYISVRCFNLRPDGTENSGDDCDDTRPSVNPAGVEVCNGLDDDCNGAIDEGVQLTFYRDADGDGFGLESMVELGCTAPMGYSLMAGDCDDTRAAINPAALEICDGIDNNCDGDVDTDCDCTTGASQSCGPPTEVGRCRRGTRTCVSGIWSDCAGAVMPSTEICNGEDDDCDGLRDDEDPDIALLSTAVTGASLYFRDVDGDSWGDSSNTQRRCTPLDGWVLRGGDCNDGDPLINPGATEICDGVNNNCSFGGAPEGIDDVPGGCRCLVTDPPQSCGSNVGACRSGMEECTPTGSWGPCFGRIGPSDEECDGIDNDCNGTVDDGCACVNGTMQACGSDVGLCTRGTQLCSLGVWGACSGRGEAPEVCNGQDDDCDGRVDEGVLNTYYLDADMDTWGNAGMTTQACAVPMGYVGRAGDCNDAVFAINPNATEICDGVDNNCSGVVDDVPGGCDCLYMQTRSCDSLGECRLGTQTCGMTGRWSACSIAPTAEVCNGRDDDCDGVTDEAPAVGTMPFYRDIDGDGYGAGPVVQRCAQFGSGAPPPGYSTVGTDCVDNAGSRSALINPGAGYQSAPHCGGYPTNCTDPITGRPGCDTFGALPRCQPSSWDYDCNGVASRQPSLCNRIDIGGGFYSCTGGRMPTGAHTSTACGTLVNYGRCCGVATCGPECDVAAEPLRCR